MEAGGLVSLLFGHYRQRVLALLLLHPEESYHVREIARLTGTSPGTLHKELSRLADTGLLVRSRLGNQVRYGANVRCPIFGELAGILRKTSGLADVLRAQLAGLANRLSLALVFGSVARGEERAGSDIDLLLVGEVGFGEAVKVLHPAQEILSREINPVVYGPAEFRKKQEAGDAFLRQVMAGEKIFLLGAEDDLGKPAGDPSSGSP
jgi:predicted nucleotidyltransferase